VFAARYELNVKLESSSL